MAIWWESLSAIQQVFALAAIPATILLILQIFLMLIGMAGHGDMSGHEIAEHDFGEHDAGGHDFGGHGGHDAVGHDGHDTAGHDGHEDHSHEHDDGLRIFTFRAIVAFFAIFGWTGIVLTEDKMNSVLAVLISAAAGFAAMLLMALFFKYAMRLQSSGNIDERNALGKTATVYIPIPPNRKGKGKITAVVQDRFIEMDAVTDSDTTLKTGTAVVCMSVSNQNIICVAPVNGNKGG